MCKNPVPTWIKTAEGGKTVTLPCKRCPECRTFRLNQWMARACAEASESSGVITVRLSFRQGAYNHSTGEVLNVSRVQRQQLDKRRAWQEFNGFEVEPPQLRGLYPEVQKFFKRLRKAGYVFRYISAGEYGEKFGRAHFHVILFFKGAVPDWRKLRQIDKSGNRDWPAWPHGHCFFQEPDTMGLKYVLKYIQKQYFDEGHFMMSKKPVIGATYMRELASRYVKAKLAPQTWQWTHPNMALRRNGVQYSAHMAGKLRRIFMTELRLQWAEAYGARRLPRSPALDQFWDQEARDHKARCPEERARADFAHFSREQHASELYKTEAGEFRSRFYDRGIGTSRGMVHRSVTGEWFLDIPPAERSEWHAKERAARERGASPAVLSTIRALGQSGVRVPLRSWRDLRLAVCDKWQSLREFLPESQHRSEKLPEHWFPGHIRCSLRKPLSRPLGQPFQSYGAEPTSPMRGAVLWEASPRVRMNPRATKLASRDLSAAKKPHLKGGDYQAEVLRAVSQLPVDLFHGANERAH